jgi:hypothetical protein
VELCTALPLCTAPHCTVHCTALHCTVHCALHCAPHCAVHCTALHCTALHCTALHCTALHCTALHCTALHCTAVPRLGQLIASKEQHGCLAPAVGGTTPLVMGGEAGPQALPFLACLRLRSAWANWLNQPFGKLGLAPPPGWWSLHGVQFTPCLTVLDVLAPLVTLRGSGPACSAHCSSP